jgi:hypothetical protein
MNNKLNNQKKVINTRATKNTKVHEYVTNVMKKAKKDLEKIETEIEILEKANN